MLKILDYISFILIALLLFVFVSQNFFWIDSLEKLYDYKLIIAIVYLGIRLGRYLMNKNEKKKQ